jgi:hypothetical protein
MKIVPKKLPVTNKYIQKLTEERKPENGIEQYLEGHVEYSDLSDKELDMYNRYLRLTSQVLARRGKFDRDGVLTDHAKTFQCSPATSERDLSFVIKRMSLIQFADMELHKYSLYQALWDGIYMAKNAGDAKALAACVKEARTLIGIGKEEGNGISSDKIEQHINIFTTDETTQVVMKKLLEKNVSMTEYNESIDVILAKEKENAQKIIDITHEEI